MSGLYVALLIKEHIPSGILSMKVFISADLLRE
jgi:hypothetical protein